MDRLVDLLQTAAIDAVTISPDDVLIIRPPKSMPLSRAADIIGHAQGHLKVKVAMVPQDWELSVLKRCRHPNVKVLKSTSAHGGTHLHTGWACDDCGDQGINCSEIELTQGHD